MKAYAKPELLKVSVNASEAFLKTYGCTPNYSVGDFTPCEGLNATIEGIFVANGMNQDNCYTLENP